MTLIDLSGVPHCACNHGMETLHKAISEGPDESIWRPHDNPWLTEICEEFTRRGQDRLTGIQSGLFLAFGMADADMVLRKAALTPGEAEGVKARLQKPLGEYTPADWTHLVNTLVRSHMHPEDLQAQADWLSFRAFLAGRLAALSDQIPDWKPMQSLLSLVTRPDQGTAPPLQIKMYRAWDWARERIGMFLTHMAETTRFRIADAVSAHIQQHGLSSRAKLQSTLLDTFGDLNRDWRRIAITESGEVANQAYLGELQNGSKVKRIEHYIGACPFCASLNGQVFTWSDTPLDDSHGWTHVWPGKTNVGRSASPRKWDDGELIPRTPDELWWPAAGVQHPHCRGRWEAIPDPKAPPGIDQVFHDWVKSELEKVKLPTPRTG